MRYDFDSTINRRNTHAIKWLVEEQELPMWVADMDFPTAPEIQETIAARAAHGVYGYAYLPDEWYSAYQNWWQDRHGLTLERDSLLFCTGVVPAIASVIRKLTTPGEKVLVQSPVYNVFFHCITGNGRLVADNPLLYNGSAYHIDFDDLEQRLADPQTTLMLLCNPHNPIGKCWERETLAEIGRLCKKHHVLVLADEIHCDLTAPGVDYAPFASINDECRNNSITCIAPTKTFNLAGLHTAAVAVPNEVLRHKVRMALSTDDVNSANVFAAEAAVAAFTRGGPWLDALRAYIQKNRETVERFVAEQIPGVKVVPGTATYLLWLDHSGAKGSQDELGPWLRQRTGLFLNDGGAYGENGRRFLRMNVACPRSVVLEGLERLKKGFELLAKEA